MMAQKPTRKKKKQFSFFKNSTSNITENGIVCLCEYKYVRRGGGEMVSSRPQL